MNALTFNTFDVISVFFDCLSFLLITNFLFAIGLFALRRWLFDQKPNDGNIMNLYALRRAEPPLLSVHLPICNEPPELVCRTIRSIADQDYPNFELIVFSNNARDPRNWRPVEAYCKQLTNVHFHHVDQVAGYKAGALNLCLNLTHGRARYIMVVDADYVLEPGALSIAVDSIARRRVALVQFPQAYEKHPDAAYRGLKAAYRTYFNLFSAGANGYDGPLPTGTLSIIDRLALHHLDGWCTGSITEDTQLGIKLLNRRLKTYFDDRVIGRGITPTTTNDFRKQRRRWVFGNFQTLMMVAGCRNLAARERWGSMAQLTAWINLSGLPIVGLCLATLAALFLPDSRSAVEPALWLSLTTIGFNLMGDWWMLGRSTKQRRRRHLRSFLIRQSTLAIGAFTWWGYAINRERPFERTDKFAGRGQSFQLSRHLFSLPVLMLLVAAGLAIADLPVAALLCVLLGAVLGMAYWFLHRAVVPVAAAETSDIEPAATTVPVASLTIKTTSSSLKTSAS